jgi:hypothetical protein
MLVGIAILAITRVYSISDITNAWNAHSFTQHITHSITSHNVYIDAFILAVLWPVSTESIRLRTSAVLSRDPRPTAFHNVELGAPTKMPETHVASSQSARKMEGCPNLMGWPRDGIRTSQPVTLVRELSIDSRSSCCAWGSPSPVQQGLG